MRAAGEAAGSPAASPRLLSTRPNRPIGGAARLRSAYQRHCQMRSSELSAPDCARTVKRCAMR